MVVAPILSVVLIVLTWMGLLFRAKYVWPGLMHDTALESLWTIIPLRLLSAITLPSIIALYNYETPRSYYFTTVKVIGHQWYWSYDLSQFGTSYDRFMKPIRDLLPGEKVQMEVDHRLVIPISLPIQVVVTSADVLHRWSVPRLGLKVDACPGRLNTITLKRSFIGLFYGFCRELCGVQHRYMPIVVESTTPAARLLTWSVRR